MVYRYARSVLMHHGHSPDDIDDYPLPAILDWLAVHDVLEQRSSIGGVPEG